MIQYMLPLMASVQLTWTRFWTMVLELPNVSVMDICSYLGLEVQIFSHWLCIILDQLHHKQALKDQITCVCECVYVLAEAVVMTTGTNNQGNAVFVPIKAVLINIFWLKQAKSTALWRMSWGLYVLYGKHILPLT